ncbi:MAG: flagellar biosynthetic protein FliR [Planctomycetota bacterium]|nr:flagellar biosynthetic protein FliR [Planctomycetota bacterium]MDA1177376.1 flagellar biosynthetic protein FliR [Planctomycetota bacterium]
MTLPHSIIEFTPSLLLVAVRMTAMCNTLPWLIEFGVSLRARLLFAALLTLLVAPSAARASLAAGMSDNVVATFVGEAIVGMSLGMSVGILLSSIRVVSGIVEMSSLSLWGTHFADGGTESSTTTGQLFLWISLLAFLSIRGEQHVMTAFLDSCERLPVGAELPTSNLLGGLTQLLQQSLLIGWRIALPLSCAGLFGLVFMAFLARISPAAETMNMAIPTLQILSIALLMISLGGVTTMFGREIEHMLGQWDYWIMRPSG